MGVIATGYIFSLFLSDIMKFFLSWLVDFI